LARVLQSPAGEAKAHFKIPFSDRELEEFVLKIGRPRRAPRHLSSPEIGVAKTLGGRQDSPEMEAAKNFGGRLFATVFDQEVRECFRSSLDYAKDQQSGLRIRLRLNAPELVNLPWEYLYNPVLSRFLVLAAESPIIRYVELAERIRPLAVKPPLYILVMISSPTDYSRLNVEQEWKKLDESLVNLKKRGLVTLERLDEAALVALQRRLRQGSYHIFHFIGHGVFDKKAQDGMLLLEDEAGRSHRVSGQDLGMILHNHPSLRLAVLNACEGARTSRSDPFAGTAQSLVRQGIPAVIAMQFEITDAAAITFAQEFYAALADGYPVDAALVEARIAMLDKNVEWGTPVLYMRSPDGRLFDWEKRISPKIDTRAKEQVKIPDLLPYLSDRSEQEYALGRALQDAEVKKPRRPFVGIIHGDERECHDMFCERLQKELLPALLRLDTERDLITTYVHEWPAAEGTPSKRFDQLQASLARKLSGNMNTGLPELVKIIAQHETPVVIRAHIPAEAWQKNEAEVLRLWLDFWNRWPDLVVGRRLCVFLNIHYKSATPRAFLWKPKSEKRNDEVRECVRRIDFSAYGGLHGVILPELKGITKGEVEDWVRQYASEFCHIQELLPKVRELFEIAEIERIPMQTLATKLKALLEQYRC
jgi:hypothetical protein